LFRTTGRARVPVILYTLIYLLYYLKEFEIILSSMFIIRVLGSMLTDQIKSQVSQRRKVSLLTEAG